MDKNLGLKQPKLPNQENGYFLMKTNPDPGKENNSKLAQEVPHYSHYTPFSKKIKPIFHSHIAIGIDNKTTGVGP